MAFNAGEARWKFTPNPRVKGQIAEAIFESVQEVFEIDIKGEAVEGSPVRRGTNRRSIDTEVVMTPQGIKATLFTQSGYGGYLELGTSKMEARPYLFPAFNKFRTKLNKLLGSKIARIK
jgi:HK97 gp10 family phage protein